MPYTLAQLAADPGPAGREVMRRHLERALQDDAFVRAHLGLDNTTPRKKL